jgi:hypothetical protein
MIRVAKLALISLLVAQTLGLFSAMVPLSLAVFPEQFRRDLAGQTPSILQALKTFFWIIFPSYVFAFFFGALSSLAVATSFIAVGLSKKELPILALIAAFGISVLLSVGFGWHYLQCQCHPNLGGAYFYKPIVFILCHMFLVTSAWLVMRKIWRTSLL